MKLWKYIRLTLFLTKANILSEMEYRFSFITKIVGMVINDFGLFALWIIFFAKFPAINGWDLRQTMVLQGVLLASFSLFAVFSAGTLEIAKVITRGELDYFLALPKNALWHISVSRTEVAAIGDFIFGVGVFFFAGHITMFNALAFFVLVVIASLIMYGFAAATQSLAFYFGDMEESAERWYWTLFGFSLYPQSVFSGTLKILMMVFVPVFFTAALPTKLIFSFNIPGILMLLGFGIAIWLIALWLFKKGLRKYESGNLINVRV